MREPVVLLAASAALLMSLLLTGVLRSFALSRRILDIPNSRSSHTEPTPRGGGLAIVLVVLTTLPLFAWRGIVSPASFLALSGAGLLVAVVGWLDDCGHVNPVWRLIVHIAAASWAIVWISELPQLAFFGVTLDLGWGGGVLAALHLVWMLNLYNFMDGIDGIAGLEAVTVCVAALVVYGLYARPVDDAARAGALLLAAAACGFLFWNFPRARIFMGDAGSGFVGIMLGILALEAGAIAGELFWAWLILLGAFVVDATLTLLRRLIRGERIYQAHRSHAYQEAARRAGSHVPVALSIVALNLAWLLPIACLVALGRIQGPVGIAVAYTPLLWLATRFGAGQAEDVDRGSRSATQSSHDIAASSK